MRLALFGDIGGHLDPLENALDDLGVRQQTLPEDLTVIQVGDLIHRGPDSVGVCRLVDHYLRAQPQQWVQLPGNHEAQYLDEPAFLWPETLDPDGQTLLHAWWADGLMRMSCAVDTDEHGPLLITHAGLTAGMWDNIKRPATAEQAVERLNALPEQAPHLAWRAGRMLGGHNPDLAAGPVWAEAGWETYQSWYAAHLNNIKVPFGQVHGHSSAFTWNKRTWNGPVVLERFFTPDRRRRHLTGQIGGRFFAGIDPTLGKYVPGPWEPLVLTGTVTAR